MLGTARIVDLGVELEIDRPGRTGINGLLAAAAAAAAEMPSLRVRHEQSTKHQRKGAQAPIFSPLRKIVRVSLLVDGERVLVQLDEVEPPVAPLGYHLNQPQNNHQKHGITLYSTHAQQHRVNCVYRPTAILPYLPPKATHPLANEGGYRRRTC